MLVELVQKPRLKMFFMFCTFTGSSRVIAGESTAYNALGSLISNAIIGASLAFSCGKRQIRRTPYTNRTELMGTDGGKVGVTPIVTDYRQAVAALAPPDHSAN